MPPPNLPPAGAQHPGPPKGWRPMSGLAITSFVLSLVFVLIAFFGVWISQLLPLGLGILTLVTVKSTEKRGRILGIWAIAIAVGAGSCCYSMHANIRDRVSHIAESALSVLSSKEASDRVTALKAWMDPASLEAAPEKITEILERYAEVEKRFGPYAGEVTLRFPLLGFGALFMPPEGVVEIGTNAEPPANDALTAAWARPRFRDKTVHMVLVFRQSGEAGAPPIMDVESGKTASVLTDIRFFDAPEAGAKEGP